MLTTITERGLITLPAIFRKEAGLKANDTLSVEFRDGGIFLRPIMALPLEIYSESRIAEFEEEEEKLAKLMKKKKK